VRTASVLAKIPPSRRALLERIRYRTPSHVDRVLLCCEGVALQGQGIAAKIGYPPQPERYSQHHDRALSQQPDDGTVSVIFVVGCLEA
jgi:hypothetical protein